MLAEGIQGPRNLADSGQGPARLGRTGEQVTTQAHGRLYEAARLGTLFSTGMTTTSIANATFTTATLDATSTPIVGIWNPLTSGKNLVVLQARLSAILTALQCTGAGTFMWCTAVGQNAISTGLTPLNRLTLLAAGSVAKGFAATALTGLVGSMTVREPSSLQGGSNYNASLLGTAVGFMPPASAPSVDQIDGGFIVPPGGVLALLCTTTPVAVSAASGLAWEEVNA